MMSCAYDYISNDFIFLINLLFRGIRFTLHHLQLYTYNLTLHTHKHIAYVLYYTYSIYDICI